MAEWSVDAPREWIMMTLYETWMDTTEAFWTFGGGEGKEDEPQTNALTRESRQLALALRHFTLLSFMRGGRLSRLPTDNRNTSGSG